MTKNEWFKPYRCLACDDISSRMTPQTYKRVRDTENFEDMFIIYSEFCEDCIGTGIQPVPYWELKGVAYEAWREAAEAVSEGPT